MHESASAYLGPWANFYVITGSSAAALTGLMFVVITLVAGTKRVQRSPGGTSIFSTPIVFHFCAAFMVSVAMSAPWRTLAHVAIALGFLGLAGVAYVGWVGYGMSRLSEYKGDVEDWTWFFAFPLLAYVGICGAFVIPVAPTSGLFAIGAGIALLILIGIRNAWDIVTYLTVLDAAPPEE